MQKHYAPRFCRGCIRARRCFPGSLAPSSLPASLRQLAAPWPLCSPGSPPKKATSSRSHVKQQTEPLAPWCHATTLKHQFGIHASAPCPPWLPSCLASHPHKLETPDLQRSAAMRQTGLCHATKLQHLMCRHATTKLHRSLGSSKPR